MSVEIKYDQNRKVLDIIVFGLSDADDLSSALEHIINSGDYPPNTDAIWDVRNSDLSNANFQFRTSHIASVFGG